MASGGRKKSCGAEEGKSTPDTPESRDVTVGGSKLLQEGVTRAWQIHMH